MIQINTNNLIQQRSVYLAEWDTKEDNRGRIKENWTTEGPDKGTRYKIQPSFRTTHWAVKVFTIREVKIECFFVK